MGVFFEGTLNIKLLSKEIEISESPVIKIVLLPFWLHSSIALIIFFEFPEVDRPINKSFLFSCPISC